MFITTLSINVGRSRANRSLVMDVFSFVDLLFVVDPPRKADGGGVVHEHVDFDLFSFVPESGVEVFVRSSLSGLFLVGLHDMVTCVIMYDVGGVRRRIGGVYVPPGTKKLEWSVVFVTGRGGAGFHFVTPPSLRPGVNSLPFLPAPYDTGPWPGCGAGRVFYFPR